MKVIVHDTLPRWYGLSWRPEAPAIVVSVHREFLSTLSPIPAEDVRDCMASFKFGQFEGSLEKAFGFDNVLERSVNGDFADFTARLPKVFRLLDENCEECGGSGRDEDRDGDCLGCSGEGKKSVFEWTSAYAVSASLGLLLDRAMYTDFESSSRAPQLLTVHLLTAHGPHGGSLGGMYSVPLVRWLAAQPLHTKILEMVDAMRRAHTHIFGEDRWNTHRFGASIAHHGGCLNVDCPGCGLYPSDRRYTGEGYEFACHNVDSAAQQLTLLAGLAALHDRVDREISAPSGSSARTPA